MKKHVFSFLAVFGLSAALASASTPAPPSKFGFKLTGGLSYQGQSDANANLVDNGMAIWSDYVKLGVFSGFTGELKPLHWGPDASAEIIYQVKPGIGIALGVGYLSTHKSKDDNAIATGEISHSYDDAISAVPVTLAICYSRPLSGLLSLSAEAGLGIYFAKWTETSTSQFVSVPHYPTSYTIKGSGLGFEIHGGIALEIAIVRPVFLVVEAVGRYAKIGNLTGNVVYASSDGTSTTTEGKFYYYEWFNGTTKKSYPQVYLYTDEEAKTDKNLVNIRDARADVSGFGLKAGVLVRL